MLGELPEQECVTRQLHVHGYHADAAKFGDLEVYGSDAPAIEDLKRGDVQLAQRLHGDLPYVAAEVVWAARKEMARTVDDILARRTRALFLNARAAIAMAPRVAELLAKELGRDQAWQQRQVQAFTDIARSYVIGA
jgi:glycerol-3-phosphate dehydrogenase